jgi:hypothetical protein
MKQINVISSQLTNENLRHKSHSHKPESHPKTVPADYIQLTIRPKHCLDFHSEYIWRIPPHTHISHEGSSS